VREKEKAPNRSGLSRFGSRALADVVLEFIIVANE
jgi:hypothetical protein